MDPSFGELYFSSVEWGLDDKGSFFISRTKLETHICSAEELGLVNGNSKFMPVHNSSHYHVETYQKKFLCMKPEDAYIYGNYDTEVGRLIRVFLNRCSGIENNCKSD